MYCALAQSSKRKELDRNVHVSYTSLWAHNASGDTCLSRVDLHVLHSSFYLCITGAVRRKSPWAKQRCVHSLLPPCQPANILGLDCLPQPRISTPPPTTHPRVGRWWCARLNPTSLFDPLNNVAIIIQCRIPHLHHADFCYNSTRPPVLVSHL